MSPANYPHRSEPAKAGDRYHRHIRLNVRLTRRLVEIEQLNAAKEMIPLLVYEII